MWRTEPLLSALFSQPEAAADGSVPGQGLNHLGDKDGNSSPYVEKENDAVDVRILSILTDDPHEFILGNNRHLQGRLSSS